MKKIAIFSPSTIAEKIFPKQVERGLTQLRNLNFEVVTFFQNEKTNVQEKAMLFNNIFLDNSIDIIVFTLGGYNAMELIPYIDYSLIKDSNIKIYGYSDCSLILNAITSKTGKKTYLGPMLLPNFCEYPKPFKYTYASFYSSIFKQNEMFSISSPSKYFLEYIDWHSDQWGKRPRKSIELDKIKIINKKNDSEDIITGTLIGGNGDSLVNVIQTDFFKIPKNSILFLEDYSKDVEYDKWRRIMNTFKLRGVLDSVNALILGQMPCYDKERMESFLLNMNLSMPIVTGFPSGHIDPITTLKIGGKVEIDLSTDSISLEA